MAKAYSLLSWNVEHFKKVQDENAKKRLFRIVETIKNEDPDVFSLYEVEGKEVFNALVEKFPGYSFHITEGPQVQEILVAVRGSLTAFFTQKVAFKEGISTLRPGALLTLTIDGQHYPILFLHLKSACDARSFGIRDHMITKAIQFTSTLKIGEQKPNYLFIGDLNTMGLTYFQDFDIPTDAELKKSDHFAGRYFHLKRLDKTYPFTWSNGTNSSIPDSNLDHCYAADHLQFKLFANKTGAGTSPVDVRGWVDKLANKEKNLWIKEYSDHSYLYLEVEKVKSS